MEYLHVPVLFQDVMDGLKIKKDGVYFDGTLGGAGHSEGILERGGRLIATDKDTAAIENAKVRLARFDGRFTLIHDDFKHVIPHLDDTSIDTLDGVLLDLGVSSYQIDNAERGFSYMKDAPLDMRMDLTQRLSAYEVVNTYSETKLSEILFDYGEERYARSIARKIVNARQKKAIESTLELSEIVASSYPSKDRYKFGNPAKRTFQAIRIEVNAELTDLGEFVQAIALRMKAGGRMCVITFHSLEDRIVKHAFAELEKDCICDKHLPVCCCNKRKEVEIITKKPILGSKEADTNKRSESAKLRIVERV